nr:phosphoinositide phosphatase SAC8-like [Malus domestica]XP_028945496.1 phosphoinositide phosphatase SAC8-like [Malus domestica]
MALLKTVQSTPGLYFSYETDITLNFQRRCKLVEGWMAKPIWKQADPRFVWNRNLLDELIEYKLPDCTAKAKGLICHTYDSLKEVYLASRTRMWRRGANLHGDVANFIETERLVEIEGFQSSLLQIRGSILLLWEQIVDLSYKPQLRIITHEQTVICCQRCKSIPFYSFLGLMVQFPCLSCVVNFPIHLQSNVVERHFFDLLQRYVSFDFHHVCGNSNFENLKVLYEEISEQFEKLG